MMFLIVQQLGGLGKRNHRDRNAAAVKLGMLRLHLTEMRLAGQSSQVPEKNQQQILIEPVSQADRLAGEIQ